MLRWVSPVLSAAAAALITGAVVATAAPGDVNVSGISAEECVVVTPPIVLPTVTISPTPSPTATPTPTVEASPTESPIEQSPGPIVEESTNPLIDASPEPTTTAEPTESASPTAP